MSTCVAPGHPECTITCPKGCIAWYDEKYKRCTTRCSGKFAPLAYESDSSISISVSEFPVGELFRMLGKKLSSDVDEDKLLTFSLESVSVEAIIDFVNGQLGSDKSSKL